MARTNCNEGPLLFAAHTPLQKGAHALSIQFKESGPKLDRRIASYYTASPSMRRRCSAAAAAAAVLCLLCLLPGRALATKSERDVNDYVTSIVRVFAQHQAYSVAPDYIDTDGSSSWWRQCVCFCFRVGVLGRWGHAHTHTHTHTTHTPPLSLSLSPTDTSQSTGRST